MSSLLNPNIELLEHDPEVKSYIYQQIVEFEPFVTPDTTVAVVARDPKKLMLRYETEGREFDREKMKKMFRIAIVLKEGDTQIQEEGLHENVYEAIKLAKDALMRKLSAIQDSIMTNQERTEQINFALQNNQLH